MTESNGQESQRCVGIMTFHWPRNYGAVLQAYALCEYIKTRLDQRVCVIDFRTPRQEQLYHIFRQLRLNRRIIKSIAFNFLLLYHLRPLRKRLQRFIDFNEEFLVRTRHYQNITDLAADPPELDAVIAGSDQVFNAEMLPADELSAYCLAPFDPNIYRLIAYAPSFGNADISNDAKVVMTRLLKHFKYLSSREAQGQSLLRELTRAKVDLVLDPVLLLNKDDWRKIASHDNRVNTPYILCYALNGREELGYLANKVKNILNIPIVVLTPNVLNPIKADLIIHDAGPRQFIWLFDNAEFVVTDSFHGTAFSVIFQKNFFIQIALQKYSSRILGFLENIGLSDRNIDNATDITNQKQLQIDYSACDSAISKLKQASETYLSKALSW